MENVLEKILEEIKGLIEKHKNKAYELVAREPLTQCYTEADIEQIKVHELAVVRDIIRKHMDNNNLHEKCSRRKWYQIGYEDGKKNDGWIPVEDKLPEEKGWYQCTCSDKEIWNDDIVRDLYYYPEIKEFVDNIRYEANGLKDIEKYYWTKYVTAWQPLPEPYKEG